MYDRLAPRGFEVLAFPCNQFGGQEPGSKEEIRSFVNGYGVRFPVFGKIDVNGPNTHPLYKFLKSGTPFLADIVSARCRPIFLTCTQVSYGHSLCPPSHSGRARHRRNGILGNSSSTRTARWWSATDRRRPR